MINKLNNDDYITINLFGKEKEVKIFSTGDNKFDEDGNYKEGHFALSEEEISCLNWFTANVNIADYKKQITDYCNERYYMIGDVTISEDELENEIDIYGIAINISTITQSKYGDIYPEISFYGDCKCDIEHGICIGFRDKKFLGVGSQDWTL